MLISADERNTVMVQLDSMLGNGNVRDSVCQDLISHSAYWYDHPHGPAKAPKHGERVVSGSIDFGANSTWVAGAVQDMINEVKIVLVAGVKIEAKQLLIMLASCLSRNVQNINGDFYVEYPSEHGYMHFGSQAIHTGEFAREFFELAKCHQITT